MASELRNGLLLTPDAVATEAQVETTEEPKVPPRVYDLYSWKTNSPNTRLVYIRDPAIVDAELAQLRPGPLGFDLEWKPTFYKGGKENPVALVQLANEDTVLLIQVTAMRCFPQTLKNVLANPSYVKAGVSILNDCKKLWADYRVNVRNCVDLGLLARTVDNPTWKGKYTNPIGLARLCETYHDLTLHKGRVTRSNWEAMLGPIQQEYAANDCHSGLTLFNKLHSLVSTINPRPLPAYYSFDLCEGYPYQPSVLPRPEILWQAFNPFYDPGPPPPPKPPKPPRERKTKQEGTETVGENQSVSADLATSRSGRHESSQRSSKMPPDLQALHSGQISVDQQSSASSSRLYHTLPHPEPSSRGNREPHRGNWRGHRGGRGWRSRARGRGGASGGSVSAAHDGLGGQRMT